MSSQKGKQKHFQEILGWKPFLDDLVSPWYIKSKNLEMLFALKEIVIEKIDTVRGHSF